MRNLAKGSHYYINEDGLVVFTKLYHFEKGFCCGNGCLHCPYDHANVTESKRSELKLRSEVKKSSDIHNC